MDDIYYEKVLNRIIQGRLRIKLGDLVLYIYEPSNDLKEESFDVYDEACDQFASEQLNDRKKMLTMHGIGYYL